MIKLTYHESLFIEEVMEDITLELQSKDGGLFPDLEERVEQTLMIFRRLNYKEEEDRIL